MKTIISKKISNHKVFTDVERTLHLAGLNVNSDASYIDFFYRLQYLKNGVDVSGNFSKKVPDWRIDNSYHVAVRDENLQPVLNPDFVEETDSEGNVINEYERYLTMPAYEYFYSLVLEQNLSLTAAFENYIALDDANGRFDL
ncbi:hypothetical protein GGR32_000126 [Mesonia hippocampi]|uniref:Uncharacterized protein n=1 Tax=Mesonia hippocampi TaxID=1628250 RepID=A0A840EUU1_9FLAO|nr:hypothetical protein [Mesonia hippocampi]MBB4117854.1 hypothetical protein [Mesonia hippocampi]